MTWIDPVAAERGRFWTLLRAATHRLHRVAIAATMRSVVDASTSPSSERSFPELSDHLLKDIGLRRTSVREVTRWLEY